MENESITFPSADTVTFHLGADDVTTSLESIVLVGEFTTEDGPYAEDHFISVWLNDNRVLEISIASCGVAAFLNKLSLKTSTPIKTTLAAETSFASRVLYPPAKSGQDLFVFKSARKGLLGLFYKNRMERRLAPGLVSLIEGQH